MKKEISFTPEMMEQLSYYKHENEDISDPRILRMKKIMKIVLENELTKRQHDCIVMRYFENTPVKEIAEKIGITPAAVYKHLHKAMTTFKKCALYL